MTIKEDDYPVIDDSPKKKSWWGNSFNDNEDKPEIPSERFDDIIPLDSEATWFKKYWRPAMAWQYISVCIFDFIVGPIVTMMFFQQSGQDYVQWIPLTLQASGFYHVAMGAALGIYAWSRGQEKLKGVEK